MLRKPEDFYKEGSKVFRKAPVNRESLQGWVKIAAGKVADANRKENSPTTRLGAAYDAVLNLSFAVLASKGWRCTSDHGHHAQALEAAASYANITESVFDRVDAIRDLRNNQYRASNLRSTTSPPRSRPWSAWRPTCWRFYPPSERSCRARHRPFRDRWRCGACTCARMRRCQAPVRAERPRQSTMNLFCGRCPSAAVSRIYAQVRRGAAP